MGIVEILLLILLAGLPYYLIIEKFVKDWQIFILSSVLLIVGLVIRYKTAVNIDYVFINISLLTAVFTFYKALKTTNLYRLSYYFLFMNSPVFLLIDIKYSIYYAVALIITLIGLYFVGTYYKNNYGSPNYAGISGLAIATPFIGFVLRVYLISLALYPPFPNAVFLFNSFIKNETGYFWYVVFGIVLFSNFFIAMRILTNTVFGKPNKIIFYKDIKGKERLGHFFIILLLTIWGLNGITEVLK